MSESSTKAEGRAGRDEFLASFPLPPMPEKFPLVSVIILNLNGEEVLGHALECLRRQDYPDFEVIVFDNGSQDKSEEVALSYSDLPSFRFEKASCNLGVAGGRNKALELARGEVVAFLDNDGFPRSDWLRNAVARLCSSDRDTKRGVGAVASAVFFAGRPGVVNGLGGGMNWQGYAGDYGYDLPLEKAPFFPEVLYPMGCGMVAWRSALKSVGLLDDALPKWYDDVELGLRIWLTGKRVVVEPRAVVEHEAHSGDMARTRAAWKRALLFEKARYRMILKYFPLKSFLWLPPYEVKDLFSGSIKEMVFNLAVRLGALLWNIGNISSALNIRRRFPLPWETFQQLCIKGGGKFIGERGAPMPSLVGYSIVESKKQ